MPQLMRPGLGQDRAGRHRRHEPPGLVQDDPFALDGDVAQGSGLRRGAGDEVVDEVALAADGQPALGSASFVSVPSKWMIQLALTSVDPRRTR